jgi:hypothetical protein
MGGIVSGKTSLGGVISAPGIPFASSPFSGLFANANTLGLSLAGVSYFQESMAGFSFGVPYSATGALTFKKNSPDAPNGVNGLPHVVAITPNGKFLYKACIGGTLVIYTRNRTNGALTISGGSPIAIAAISGVLVSQDGIYLYVLTSSTVAAYSIDQSTGAVALTTTVVFAFSGILDFVLNKPGTAMFVSNPVGGFIQAVTVAGGVLTLALTYSATTPYKMSLSGDDAYLYVSSSLSNLYSGFSVFGATLVALQGSPYNSPITPDMWVAHPTLSNIMYLASAHYITEYWITVGGILSFLKSYPVTNNTFVAVDHSGTFLYRADSAGRLFGYSINIDGSLTALPGYPVISGYGGITSGGVSADNVFLYTENQNTFNLSIFATSATIALPLVQGFFDPAGNLLNINGSLSLNGSQVPNADVVYNFNLNGDQVVSSLDASKLRTGTQSTTSAGNLYILLGNVLCMSYESHNSPISVAGVIGLADAAGVATLITRDENEIIKSWFAPAVSAGAQVAYNAFPYYTLDLNTGIVGATGFQLSDVNAPKRLSFSGTTPTITSGFGAGSTIIGNGTLAFQITIGSNASSGVIGLPAATIGWILSIAILSPTPSNLLQSTVQTVSTTNSASIANRVTATGNPTNWPVGTILMIQATAF